MTFVGNIAPTSDKQGARGLEKRAVWPPQTPLKQNAIRRTKKLRSDWWSDQMLRSNQVVRQDQMGGKKWHIDANRVGRHNSKKKPNLSTICIIERNWIVFNWAGCWFSYGMSSKPKLKKKHLGAGNVNARCTAFPVELGCEPQEMLEQNPRYKRSKNKRFDA